METLPADPFQEKGPRSACSVEELGEHGVKRMVQGCSLLLSGVT